MTGPKHHSRRTFIRQTAATAAGIFIAPKLVPAPAIVRLRPAITHGIASGDVSFDTATIWSRADRRARMIVEWATSESMKEIQRVDGPWTGMDADFTAKLELRELPSGQRIFYRVRFEDERFISSPPEAGSFITASPEERDVFFAWSGDTCGQGYGISAQCDGLKTYESIRALRPDFFVHSGDNIYADVPIQAEMKTPDGTIFRNLTTPEKSKVAETLDEFRGNYRYNLLDAHVRRCNSEVPVFAQWDDHEVLNNWYPGEVLEDNRYTIKDVDVLARNARQAFGDYLPVRGARIYRNIRRGPLCELFFLDLRSYRGPNTGNRQETPSHLTDYLGGRQIRWLKQALANSGAVWKIICSDMPIGLVVGDGKNTFENCANGRGPALGRELDVAELLRFMKEQGIRNVIWLTADVHYAASIHYNPAKAQFPQFDSFWEFVSGPLHAASLGPGALDNTFGPELRWSSRKRGEQASGPHTSQQYFSTVRIDGATKTATVTHLNRDGERLWSIDLEAV